MYDVNRKIFIWEIKLIVVMALLFSMDSVYAQKNVIVTGRIIEDITRKAILDAHVTLLSADSTILQDSIRIGKYNRNGVTAGFVLMNISNPGKYIVRLEKDGYETTYKDFEIARIYKHEDRFELPTPFVLKRITTQTSLPEVVIKATKIKFYVRGDTIIYNADAFELNEGSMLDALVRQLPDVELKKGGEIYIRGKRVSELLLNGRDFFNGDRQVILDNLPSYMVKNIKVYEREFDVFDKYKESDQSNIKILAMDVQLKRKYSIGWVANSELGLGTKEKKLARLFCLRFTPQSRLSLFANINNLNDDRSPGDNGEWNPLQQEAGERNVYNGGLDYNVLHKNGDYKISGNLKVNYLETSAYSITNTENFLSGGNTFGKAYNSNKEYFSSVSTSHKFNLVNTVHLKAINLKYMELSPYVLLSNSHSNGVSASITLAEDANRILGSNWKEVIMSLNSSSELMTYGLNRTILKEKNNENQFHAGTTWGAQLLIPHDDRLYLIVNGSMDYISSHSKMYNHFLINYYNPISTDFRNRYNFNKTEGFTNKISICTPSQNITRNTLITIDELYTFEYRRQMQTRSLYLLNKLNAWGIDTEHNLGDLPSADELLLAMDNSNSYNQTQTDKTHRICLNLNYGKSQTSMFEKTIVQGRFTPMIRIENSRFDYFRREVIDTVISRSNVFFEPSFNLSIFPINKPWTERWDFSMNYKLTHTAPRAIYLTGISDNSDPLNILQSNKFLKNSSTHNLELNFQKPLSRKRHIRISSDLSVFSNMIALGYIYNRNTGVRTIKPDNVNGNWKTQNTITYRSRIDKKEKWSYQSSSYYTFVNSVDLIGTSTTGNKPVRSTVGTTYLRESAFLRYNPNVNMDFNIKGNITYQHSRSIRADFRNINVCDFDYGISAKVELPLNVQLSSDITMYCRRGYVDHSMNTNDLLWNARVSKQFMHGNLVCMFDAFDILGNRSNTKRIINAQGRVETWNNVTPRFFLLHAIFRLNKQPKKTNLQYE